MGRGADHCAQPRPIVSRTALLSPALSSPSGRRGRKPRDPHQLPPLIQQQWSLRQKDPWNFRKALSLTPIFCTRERQNLPRSRSAGFQACCIAGFQPAGASNFLGLSQLRKSNRARFGRPHPLNLLSGRFRTQLSLPSIVQRAISHQQTVLGRAEPNSPTHQPHSGRVLRGPVALRRKSRSGSAVNPDDPKRHTDFHHAGRRCGGGPELFRRGGCPALLRSFHAGAASAKSLSTDNPHRRGARRRIAPHGDAGARTGRSP